MSWTETRRAAREEVHRTFGVDARYHSAPNVGIGSPVSVRVHNRIVTTGDLSSGYASTYEEVERVIFKREDAVAYSIATGGAVKMEDGRVYRLAVKLNPRDDFSVTFDVTRV